MKDKTTRFSSDTNTFERTQHKTPREVSDTETVRDARQLREDSLNRNNSLLQRQCEQYHKKATRDHPHSPVFSACFAFIPFNP